MWSLASLGPDHEGADFTPERRQALITTMSHYNRVGFLLRRGLIKDEEILAYWAFGAIAADKWAMSKGYMSRSAIVAAAALAGLFAIAPPLLFRGLAPREEAEATLR